MGRQTSSELKVPAGISRTLIEESDNESRDIIIIDSDTEEASYTFCSLLLLFSYLFNLFPRQTTFATCSKIINKFCFL